jgi:hypothetical protein
LTSVLAAAGAVLGAVPGGSAVAGVGGGGGAELVGAGGNGSYFVVAGATKRLVRLSSRTRRRSGNDQLRPGQR